MRFVVKNHKIPPIAGRKLPRLWQWRNGEGAFSAIFNAFVNILRRVGKIIPANVKCFDFLRKIHSHKGSEATHYRYSPLT